MPDVDRADLVDLELAVGRVAITSAVADDRLRLVAQDLAGAGDPTWLLFEGQSTEWLINAIGSMLHEADPYRRRWTTSMHDELGSAIADLKGLRNHRNTVIHGTWERVVLWGEDEVKPRPWGPVDDTPVWYCMRSKYRTYGPPSRWTVSDVELLAAKIDSASTQLMRVYAQMRQHWLSEATAETHWERRLNEE